MISLAEFRITQKEQTETKGEFEISPLPTGYGHTLGNMIRRVLETSIPGSAVTAVKIDGVQHEYSTLAGLSDDVLTVVLAFKNIIFISKVEEPVKLEIDVKGKDGQVVEVKASDIKANSDVEIINKDYVITKLTGSKTRFKAEITVERGVGYQLPDEAVRQEVGVLPVDAIFSPVKLVSYSVTQTRVGQQTDLDKVNITITTNGSIAPSDALGIAANLLQEMATNLSENANEMVTGNSLMSVPTVSTPSASQIGQNATDKKLLVSELNLSTRLTNALVRAGFDDLSKLEGFTEEEVANIRGMGEKSLVELFDALKKNGVNLI